MSAKFSILDKTAPLRGVFSMRVIDRSGKVIREYSDHNMIVNTAREALARLVSEGDQSKRITRFAVGVNDETPTPADTIITACTATPSWGMIFRNRASYGSGGSLAMRRPTA